MQYSHPLANMTLISGCERLMTLPALRPLPPSNVTELGDTPSWVASYYSMPFNDTSYDSFQEELKRSLYMDIRRTTYGTIMPVVLAMGIVGNIINIAVFSQSKLYKDVDVMERSATVGLVSLAIADLLFCVVGFPSAFVDMASTAPAGPNSSTMAVITLYYVTYRGAMLNLFLFMSTWFIIALSMERFVAIVHPFIARRFIKVRRTVASKFVIVLLSVIINVPEFLQYRIKYESCSNGDCGCYYAEPNLFLHKTDLAFAYSFLWHSFGTFIPLVVLAFSNARLLVEIYRSTARERKQLNGPTDPSRDPTKITCILVMIVTLFLLLVCPSMILSFLKEFAIAEYINMNHYQIAVVISNLTQAVNFSINFLLYCAVSPRFRQQVATTACKRLSLSNRTTSSGSRESHKHCSVSRKHKSGDYELIEMNAVA